MIVKPITSLVNLTNECSAFPDSYKIAMVPPLHINNNKENYRPVSILPVISKIYETAINEQLSSFFSQHISMFTTVEQFRSQIGTWSGGGGGGGSAHARSVQTVKFYVHLSVV